MTTTLLEQHGGSVFRRLRAVLAQSQRLGDVETSCREISAKLDNLTQTVAELQAAMEWSQHEIKTLRGRVTGGLRKKGQDGDAEAPVDRTEELNALIRAGRSIRPGR